MVDSAFYLVTEDIARRVGVINQSYRTIDGRYIVDNKDLQRLRLTSEEFITGLKGVEMITNQEAKELITKNNFKMGEPPRAADTTTANNPAPEELSNEEEVVETPTEEGENNEQTSEEATEEEKTNEANVEQKEEEE